MASQHSPLRRSPTQSRAAATLRAIREAALRILKEEGHARLTTNRIAEVAGISIGSLYQYYADKHAIAADICNELLTSELDDIRRLDRQAIALAENSLDATLEFFVAEQVARHRRLYLQLRDFYLEIHWKYDFEAYSRKRYPNKPTTAEWLPSALEPTVPTAPLVLWRVVQATVAAGRIVLIQAANTGQAERPPLFNNTRHEQLAGQPARQPRPSPVGRQKVR